MVEQKPQGYIANLVRYIRKNLSKGYTEEALKWALLSQGYTRAEFEKAIKIVHADMAKELPPVQEKPVITIETEPPQEVSTSFWQKIKLWFS